MSLKPIFDTNVFGHVQAGLIPTSDFQRLLAHRPRHGWALSHVTALELLAGVHFGGSEKFPNAKRTIELAMQLSKGRVLEDPRILICRHVLRIPFPSDQVAPAASIFSRYLDGVRRAPTLDQLLQKGVPYRGKRLQVSGFSAVADVTGGVKKQWLDAVEKMATETYPEWQRVAFITGLLEWLHAKSEPRVVDEICRRLDAVLEFAIFVTREFLLRNYSAEKHDSDVFDQFQLQYLAMDEFIIVSGDADLLLRTKRSAQAQRIMSFDQFLRSM